MVFEAFCNRSTAPVQYLMKHRRNRLIEERPSSALNVMVEWLTVNTHENLYPRTCVPYKIGSRRARTHIPFDTSNSPPKSYRQFSQPRGHIRCRFDIFMRV